LKNGDAREFQSAQHLRHGRWATTTHSWSCVLT
jgi:hypothetical protein